MQNVYMKARINCFINIHPGHAQIVSLVNMAVCVLKIKIEAFSFG